MKFFVVNGGRKALGKECTMMQFNILRWCDDKISYLKEQGIDFKNGIPQLPAEYVYDERPSAVSTFAYRNDIPDYSKSRVMLTFYMFEDKLWPRLSRIDADIEILKDYGAVSGFDLSPCIGMLRPRQRLSILVNAIHSCYLGTKGIKILPNYRAGDFGTLCAADYFPDNCSFIISNLGCTNNGFKSYGEYQLDIVLQKKKPAVLFVYGSLYKEEAARLIRQHGFEIISFPDRRNRVRNNSQSYHYYLSGNKICRELYTDTAKRRMV